jgi:8-oxo-dGTP pyrophosphatase MutT (NUDIX family)
MTLAERLRVALGEGMARDVAVRTGDGPIPGAAPSPIPTPAAVLVAITDRPEPGVILTQRPETMRKHPGQVAFPGGRVDPGENDITAALREAEEEVALDPALVDVVGTADPYLTGTGFRIMPVLGVIPPDLPLVPSEAEVAAVFEVPLGWLLDPASHGIGHLEFRGEKRHFVEMHWPDPVADRRIWGATAAMIVNLSKRLRWPL